MADATTLLQAALLGLLEGLTEFIPVSSTAHLLILGEWIGFSSGDGRVFEVVIQFGAILAVIWIFRERLWQLAGGLWRRDRSQWLFARNLALAFLPAAFVGALLISQVKWLYDYPGVFVFTLIVGGLIMLWVERRPPDSAPGSDDSMSSRRATAHTLDDISWRQALAVGVAQCVAMVPGTSRSGATIIGGMLAGIQRKTATEFSFFLAMPTMLAAASYDLWRNMDVLSAAQGQTIAVGFVAAFVSALVVVRAVLRFVGRHTYRPFAWYRIGLGLVVLAWMVWR